MPEAIPFIAQIEQVFWARPLSVGTLVAIFTAIVVLSLYLYRRSWGLPLWLRGIPCCFPSAGSRSACGHFNGAHCGEDRRAHPGA
jgi:hypothetical protein